MIFNLYRDLITLKKSLTMAADFLVTQISNSSQIIKETHSFIASNKFEITQEAIRIKWGKNFHYIIDFGFILYDQEPRTGLLLKIVFK